MSTKSAATQPEVEEKTGDGTTAHTPVDPKITHLTEAERDGRIEMGARDRAHKEDDRHHHQPGCRDGGRPADRTVARSVHHRSAGTYEDQEERSEELRKESSPLLRRIVESAHARVLQGEQRPPRRRRCRFVPLTVDHLAHPLEAAVGTRVTIAVTASTHIVRTG